MGFFSCELRCGLLDRQDQLNSAVKQVAYLESKVEEEYKALEEARIKYENSLKTIKERKKFIKLLKSTMGVFWIDRPDILEKSWMRGYDE